MQTVLEIDDAPPPDGVREQVAVERRVLREQPVEREHGGRHHQFVEADLARRDLGPLPMRQPVVGVGPASRTPLKIIDANASLQ